MACCTIPTTEALFHTANALKKTMHTPTPMLSYRQMPDQCYMSHLPQLKQVLQRIMSIRVRLHFNPSNFGIHGTEEADKMAMLGAQDEQQENKVTSTSDEDTHQVAV